MMHNILGVLIILIGTLQLQGQEEDAIKEDIANAIDVSDEDAITRSIGKAVMVTGKVRHSDSSPKTSDVRVWFSDSGFRLLIKSDVYDSKEDWGIDGVIGKEVFVHGKVIRSGDFIQINLTSPGQMATVGIWANLANVNLRQGNQIYKRRRSQLAGQERDALIHDLTSLSSEVRSWRDESIYIENLLSDFRKNLEMQSLLLNLVWPSNLSSLTKKLKIQFTLILP